MIDSVLKLIDYLIKLVEIRDEKLEKYFDRYVTPTYELAEVVFKDYFKLLNDLKRKIERDTKPLALIKFLENGRMVYQPVRMKLRGSIYGRFGLRDPKLTRFELGILGLLHGGAVTFDERDLTHLNPYIDALGHTLLDILNMVTAGYTSRRSDRDNLLHRVKDQLSAIERSWNDVATGYAELQAKLIPTPKRR